jgi:hypothetical protein
MGSRNPTTPYKAEAICQFSFSLPDTLLSEPTTQVTDFSYVLNGTTGATSLPGGTLFYSVADDVDSTSIPPSGHKREARMLEQRAALRRHDDQT